MADLSPAGGDVAQTEIVSRPAPSSAVNLIQVFEPLRWQIPPFRDLSPILLLTGAAGGGKSQLAAEKIHALAQRYPGSTSLILRKARESMTNGTVPFFSQMVIGPDPRVRELPSKHRWEYKNGSVVVWGGMKDQAQREAIRSIGQKGGVDFVWMEEANAFSEEDFNELILRMRGRAAGWTQIILTTNPDRPSHWIYQRLISGREASVYYSRASDNPYNPPQYLESLLKLTGVQYLRLVEGRWVQAEGVVYDNWEPRIHKIRRFEIPNDWRRIRCVDFGYTNPFCCLWMAIDPDGRIYVYREIYKTRRLVEDHARDIVRLTGAERIEATVADHDAEDRATLARYGVPTIAAYKDILRGISAMKSRLAVEDDGRARIYWFEDALVEVDEELKKKKKPTCSLDEFESYRYPPKNQRGNKEKELPLDEDNHGMDAARYGVAYVDELKVKGDGRAVMEAAIDAPERHHDVIENLSHADRPRDSDPWGLDQPFDPAGGIRDW